MTPCSALQVCSSSEVSHALSSDWGDSSTDTATGYGLEDGLELSLELSCPRGYGPLREISSRLPARGAGRAKDRRAARRNGRSNETTPVSSTEVGPDPRRWLILLIVI